MDRDQGRGPIAGVAELRVEGLRVARQTISLDGYYEFVDVTLPSRQSSRIEVYVYDRFDMTAPVEVHDHTRGATDQMLSAGASVVMGGIGDSGNYLDQLLSDTSASGGMSAFAQSRYGLSDRERGTRFTPETVSTIGSITKQFTGAAILKLREQGRLQLDQTLDDFYPSAPPDKAAITLHQLLTHTSGLAPGVPWTTLTREFGAYCPEAVWWWVVENPPRVEPDSTFIYSDLNYLTLRMIVERVSGEPLDRFADRELFDGPVGHLDREDDP